MNSPRDPSRREFLQRTALGAATLGIASVPVSLTAGNRPPHDRPALDAADPLAGPARHPIIGQRPAGSFMDGAILGNGEMGVVVEARPDVVLLHVGHNSVWDQRMTPIDREKLQTFDFAMKRILAIPSSTGRLADDPWFREYLAAGKDTYAKRKYPRPHCCGTVAISIDRRKAEILGHRILIDRGMCVVEMTVEGRRRNLEVLVEPSANRIWARLADESGQAVASPFRFVAILIDGSMPKEFPTAEEEIDLDAGRVGYRQILPYEEIREKRAYRPHDRDRAFSLSARLHTSLHQRKPMPGGADVGAWSEASPGPMVLAIELTQGLAADVTLAKGRAPEPTPERFAAAQRDSATMWKSYWEKSSVALDDALLERTWYWNNYFLRCAMHAQATAPGMYAICPYPNKDMWWHGDYHMDYNCQQAFWGTFSSNHPELNLPYVGMVHHVLPHAREWAQNYYRMRGACFPVSSYPIELRGYPYGAPVFNWMMCLSTWTVQGLWWHYVYTKDLDYLRNQGFAPIKAVVQFMIDYINRPEVKAKDWGDRHAHIWPSFPPEIYGLMPGLPREYNADNLVDLTLLRFVFRGYLQACRELKIEAQEARDMKDAQDILDRLPPYPTAQSKEYGEIFVSVPVEDPEKVYNVPINLMTVFPGEEHGLHSPRQEYDLAARTARSHQNEGGNEIVFLSLQKARLGLLDLEKFKREIEYALMPNGSCTDKNLQTGGRFGFSKTREYDWMSSFGIWFENFALPVVINECMLQSYNGELRFFANWPKEKRASFRTLRAAGAFLVSADYHDGRVDWVEIHSEKGGDLVVISPWANGLSWSKNGRGSTRASGTRITIPTQPGDRIRLTA